MKEELVGILITEADQIHFQINRIKNKKNKTIVDRKDPEILWKMAKLGLYK
jgi:hypothetical protein